MPERQFAMSKAVLEKDAGIEHEGMKNHEDVERRQHGRLPSQWLRLEHGLFEFATLKDAGFENVLHPEPSTVTGAEVSRWKACLPPLLKAIDCSCDIDRPSLLPDLDDELLTALA